MTKITEFRMPLPFEPEKYQIGQLYMCSRGSSEDSTSDDGIEFVENKPFDDGERKGQYTKKIFHISSYLPKFMQALVPKGAFDIVETSQNCFPYIRTSYYSPLLKDRLELVVTSYHVANDDCGQDNALGMNEEDLKKREIDVIDIVNDELRGKDYEPEFDPTTQAVPLQSDWRKTTKPLMTAYKSIKCKVAIFGIQGKTEKYALSAVRNVFLKYHRKVYAWENEWKDLTMDDIRAMEESAKANLEKIRAAAKEEIRDWIL